jgi:ATP synthase protein I
MNGKSDPPEMMKKFGMAMALGTAFFSYIVAGGVVGYFLDQWLGTSPWMLIIFFLIGVGGAIYNVFKIAARLD